MTEYYNEVFGIPPAPQDQDQDQDRDNDHKANQLAIAYEARRVYNLEG